MKQSLLFTRTLREDPKDEESLNAKLLIRAGFIRKEMAGVYALLPLGLKVKSKIESIIRRKMDSVGGQEILLSVLHPKAAWERTGRWDSFDVLFRFTSYFSKIEYVLGPTHEEMVTPMMADHVFSYRDLPVFIYQFQEKFRDEKRAKSGILRGREFIMKDLYSFHASEEDLDAYYDRVLQAYVEIFDELGIGDKTYITFASGGSFAKYSHEFQTVADAGEDIIHICDKCRVAVNDEVLADAGGCPSCGNKELYSEKAIEVGNIFKLKDKFSSSCGLKFKDESGEEKNVIMGCYGIGVSRLVGTIIEASHDEKGMIWPEPVAPFKFHLIELKKDLGHEIYKILSEKGIDVLYDDRDVSAGEKFADADLIGLPYRLVVSDRTEGKIELKKRNENKTSLIDVQDILKL